MKTVAFVSALAAFGGLIVMAVAGVSGATAVLFTGLALVAMIALGNILGGRTTPNRAPQGTTGEVEATAEAPTPEPEDRRGTMGP